MGGDGICGRDARAPGGAIAIGVIRKTLVGFLGANGMAPPLSVLRALDFHAAQVHRREFTSRVHHRRNLLARFTCQKNMNIHAGLA